jgi:hypothetical protein
MEIDPIDLSLKGFAKTAFVFVFRRCRSAILLCLALRFGPLTTVSYWPFPSNFVRCFAAVGPGDASSSRLSDLSPIRLL